MEREIDERTYKKRYPITSRDYRFDDLKPEEKRGLNFLLRSQFKPRDRLALGILSSMRDWAPKLPFALAKLKRPQARKRLNNLLKAVFVGSKDWPSLPDFFDDLCLTAKFMANFDSRSLAPYARIKDKLELLKNIDPKDIEAVGKDIDFRPYIKLPARFIRGKAALTRSRLNPFVRKLEKAKNGPKGDPNKQRTIIWLRDFFCFHDKQKNIQYRSKDIRRILNSFGLETLLENILRTLRDSPTISHPGKPILLALNHRYPGEVKLEDPTLEERLEEGKLRYGDISAPSIDPIFKKNR